MCTFVPEMKQSLNVESVNDYARYVGAEELHPLVSIIHYDELEHCRHSLNNYQVYGVFLLQESPYTITYGQGHYSHSSGSLLCVAPGQTGGVSDNGEIIILKDGYYCSRLNCFTAQTSDDA